MTHLNHRNILLTIALLSAFILSAWLTHESFLSLDEANNSQPTTPDAFVTQAHYTHYDRQGQWSSRIESPRVLHYPENDSSTMDNPHITAHPDKQLTWVITADHATTHSGLKVVYLQDHVKIQRLNAAHQVTLTMTTSALTAYPQRKEAETDQPVTIIQPGSTVQSVGLKADLKTGDIHLLSQVHGTYEKPPL